METKAGVFLASFSSAGLRELDFPNPHHRVPPISSDVPTLISAWQASVTRAVNNHFAGQESGELPPLDWTGRSEFHQKVWRALLRIPMGQTRTYSEIADDIGMPGAARAVGTACGANPIPVIVPCHRVLAAGGKIGGFSAGIEWKHRLLAAEKAQLL